jgi:uncharacterized protein involved in exopolysaccharide biosynthesis
MASTSADLPVPELDAASLVLRRWRLVLSAPILGAVLAVAVSFAITPLFTARTLFLPPQQQQSSAASALASLGALSGLAGGAGLKSTADQFVSLLQSSNVADRLIDQFKLIDVYEVDKRYQARRVLDRRVRVSLGKKDGLITVEVDDHDATRAAEIANRHVAELRRLSAELTLTESQQRRSFFEGELKRTQADLGTAQAKLQSSGFNAGAIKAEPKAAAEGYARLKADATAAQVKLRTLQTQLAESAPEIRMQEAQVSALNAELQKLERAANSAGDAGYLSHYREFKYQETLFDLLSKQFELARLDEAREGSLIQVVDVATAPEIKSSPRRSYFAAAGAVVALLVALLFVLGRPLLTPAAPRGA